MAGKRQRALQKLEAEQKTRRLRKQPHCETPEPFVHKERPRFSLPIPRFFLTRPEGEGFGYLFVDIPQRPRAVFGFTSREKVDVFMKDESLDYSYECTFIGYNEMREWLESWEHADLDLIATDAASTSEVFIQAAKIQEILDVLEHSADEGDEIEAMFSSYCMLDTEPRGTDAQRARLGR